LPPFAEAWNLSEDLLNSCRGLRDSGEVEPNAAGEFTIVGLRAGRHDLAVVVDNLLGERRVVTIPADGATVRADFGAQSLAELRGRLECDAPRAWEFYNLVIENESDSPLVDAGSYLNRRVARLSKGNLISMRNVPSGTYRFYLLPRPKLLRGRALEQEWEGDEHIALGIVALRSGGPPPVFRPAVSLACGSLRIQVRDADRPAPGAHVMIARLEGTEEKWLASAGSDGVVEIEGLRAGEYHIWAQDSGLVCAPARIVNIRADVKETIALDIESFECNITIRDDATGEPLSHRTFYSEPVERCGVPRATQLDGNGHFVLRASSGIYTFEEYNAYPSPKRGMVEFRRGTTDYEVRVR
jgi:hypothetical protein